MLLASEHLALPLRLATIVVPVAVYFLILGLLNSRRHPSLLGARQDFALLAVALSPLALLPLLSMMGFSPVSLAVSAAIVAVAAAVLAPRGNSWVIYNLSAEEARRLVARALADCDTDAQTDAGRFTLPGGGEMEISGFGLLRNVTIRMRGSDDLAGPFEAALAKRVAACHSAPAPMAMALLLVATAMLVVPMMMVAQRAPEIVRILTDLLG
jgi:hypothetical protein